MKLVQFPTLCKIYFQNEIYLRGIKRAYQFNPKYAGLLEKLKSKKKQVLFFLKNLILTQLSVKIIGYNKETWKTRRLVSVFLSLRLAGVETLESVSQNFKSRFYFINFVSDFFSKLNFSKRQDLILGIRVLIYKHLWHKKL